MKHDLSPLAGPFWRMIRPRWQRQPFSGEGARRYGGRWNMKGWPTLYLSDEYATAIAEYHGSFVHPGMLVPYRLEATRIADLTGDDPRVADALAGAWEEIARREGEVPPSWALAQELIAAGAEGALVPSVQHRAGRNLVLWRWHDASGGNGGGEGAALALPDPERALAAS